ncbi:uncharacterized protein TA17790 [Theileria annulata]|uniref:Uncharacterized protein n=1 Tax=Theileria annulata TaxID=5874 RepID=Q4UB87_THEAN|nr:uncharacterized protein TA17790 [Theileria annulata]CAI75914.1 hypothetical protein TA17790 [Theileria annulata]|eukprot:XP_955390.1 hypothetical protein TA17790 [Theileria annulata]
MHKRSYRRDGTQRGGYISQKPRLMKEQTSQAPREPTQHHFTYQDKRASRDSVTYPPAENTNYTNLRGVNKRSSPEGVQQPQSHYKYKRPREGAFPKRIQLTPHFRKEFQNKEFTRTQPVHINEVVPVSPKIGPYMPMLHPQQPLVGNMQNLSHIPQNFINSPFSGPQRMPFGPKESMMHMMIPPQPVVFDNLMPFPKAPMKLLDSPVSGLQMNFLEEYHQFNLKPGLNSVEEYERIHFNIRLENLYKVLKEVNRVSNKIKFTLISIFRVRVGYRLKPFEKAYLENADRVYRYLLFMYLINGYKESLNFEENPNVNDVAWEMGKFRKFFNEESDVSVVCKSILINNRSKRVLNDNRKDYRNSIMEGYKLVKWDSSPRITYLFDNYRLYDPSEIPETKEDKNIVLIRMLDVKSIINNPVIFKNLGSMYTNINECVLKMLGYYSLICPDESYIIIISSILPTLTLKQLKIFYLNLSNLLDSSKCDLQIYYLERFIERFLPICLSQNRECWNPIITKIVSQINPLKLTNKKYLTCCISLIRSLKSFCDIFVECEETTVSVFLMTLKYLIESSEDSRILVRGESTELLIQIWLNPSGKKILIKYMNHDIIRILGSLSGIQSIKLNIWSYLLSKEGKDEIMSSKGVKTEESVLSCIFRENYSDNNLTKLIGQKELSYIYSLFPTLSLPNKNIGTGDIKDKQYLARVALFCKSILQFEKLSVVVRLSYMLYKKYFKATVNVSNVDSNKESIELVVKELEKNNNLGIFVEHFLIILMNNLGISASCLESANVKLSVILDMLLFNFSFNSSLSSAVSDKKDLIRIENRNFLNLIKLTNNNSVLLLINLFEKFFLFNKFCNSLKPEVREHLEGDFEKSGPGVFDVILNINVITYFINNNVEMLRMIINYLENIIYHYNSEFTTTFCLNTISSFVISSMVQVMSSFKRLIAENEQPQLKEIIGIIKKANLYKLLLLYNLNINNLKLNAANIAISYNPVKETVVTRLKTDTNVDEVKWLGYKKIVLANVSYDNLTKFILIQSYMLTLEFFSNYQYYNSVNNFTLPQPIGELEKQLEEEPEQLTEENLLLSIMTKDAIFVNHLGKLMNSNYKLPNYELSNNVECPNTKEADYGSTLLLYRCNFELFDDKKHENEDSNEDELNCKVGYMIDRIVILSVFLDSNQIDKSVLFPNVKKIVRKAEFDEMVVEILSEVYNFGVLVKDEDEEEEESNSELILYELLYYIVKLSLAGSKETKSSDDKNDENNFKTEKVVEEKFKTALNLLDKLLSKLSSVNSMSDQEVFNNSINKMFKLKLKDENYTLIEINESDQEEDEVSESNESGDELKTEEQSPNEKESRAYLLPEKDNTRLVLETIIKDKLLWERFNRFPIILNSLIKISPTNNLLLFFSSFTNLQLKLNYQVKHNLVLTDNELNHILTNHEYLFSILNEDLLKIINEHSSDEQELETMEQFEHGEWFRYYFLYVQLLVRMYEVKHYNNPVVNMDRNFYRNFTMPLVEYEQLSEYEYLSKEIVLYLLNCKQITNDNNIVCYVGSDSKKSLFTYFMKGYNLSETTNSNNEKEKQSSGSELEDLYLLLFFLSKISKVNNIRILQVFVFSIFPILIHTIPNKIIFDYVYNSLINIKLGKYPNSFLFIKNLLLTVLFNWYHKYFFTYNFFIYQYNNNQILDKDFVNQYITKCQNNYDIELTFNFTNIKIPLCVIIWGIY